MGVIFAIKTVKDRGLRKLWIECDSMLNLEAVKSALVVPWIIKNR